ncbi:MAG TPA: hypothetical protein VHY22_04035 [Chthoniobacteraceae bacterium]|jgi:hypothetical protein|nr:hypothetical protein [Chthoniobacteraceae bacterium]
MNSRRIISILALLAIAVPLHAQTPWRDQFLRTLAAMGAHNWIVVAEPAYPLPNSNGIEVLPTDLSQIDLLTLVLNTLANTRRVQPTFYTTTELPFVLERDAIGIGAYQAQLSTLLKGGQVYALPQEEIDAKLDAASHNYKVLLLKSTTTLPYTSVYIDLRSGYWNQQAENRLRAAMQAKPGGQ